MEIPGQFSVEIDTCGKTLHAKDADTSPVGKLTERRLLDRIRIGARWDESVAQSSIGRQMPSGVSS
jgi:hypothetical protein